MSLLRGLLSLLIVLAMAALGALFALQNEQPVPLDILIMELQPRSLALWILAAFGLGGVLGMLAAGLVVLRLRARILTLKRQLSRTRSEIEGLRDQAATQRISV